MDKTNSVLSIWASLGTKVKQMVKELTKPAVRRKKMNLLSIDTTNQTVTVYESSNPNVTITIPYRAESGISQMSVGQSVQVEWIYDDLSTAVAVCPGKGWASLEDIQNAIGAGGGGGGGDYLPLTGGTLTGALTLEDALNHANNKWVYWNSADGERKYGILGVNPNNIVGIGSASCGLRIHNSTDIAVDNPASWRTALGSDSAPTSGSTNFVESGGVYDALAEKMDKWDLLWENPSITSAFAAQTLSPSFAGYDFYLLIYGLSNTSPNNRMSMFLRVGEQSSMSFTSWYGSSTLAVNDRSFYFTNNKIHFNDCTRHVNGQSSSATYNNGAIPQKIYGIKNS